MSQDYEGQLELTWTNKHLRLLADEDGRYQWVEPSDHRVAEVRLLHNAGTVGDVAPDSERARDSLLIRGDALSGLHALAALPEFAEEYLGKVRLAYLDPPFNTQQSFLHYDDNLEHSVWLTMMRDRLLQVKKLLAPNGSIWVHLNDDEMPYCKALMDELFGRDNFVATVVWQKRYSRDNRPAIGPVHDYLLVYSPSGDAWKQSRNRVPRVAAKEYRNPNNDPKGPWRPVPMDAQGHRPNQMYDIVTPAGVTQKPPRGRCWSMVRERLDELLARGDDDPPSRIGRIYFGKDGRGRPNVIRYLSEDEGLVPWTWWPHDEVGHTDEAKKESLALTLEGEAFDTPKPERLLQRILQIGSNPGDIVLDPFLGSGTTAAVAQKMDRRFVGIERSRSNIESYVLPRLRKVVAGEDRGGVTEAVDWQGGGGFRIFDVGPTMFAEDEGLVVLAEWAAGTELARATAAQMSFAYEPDGPLCGRKGRQRLAVIDGLVSPEVVRLLLDVIAPEERLVVAGTSLDPQAEQELRKTRPGSRALKIPGSILVSYADAFRWQPLVATPTTAAADPVAGNGTGLTDEPEPAPLTSDAPSAEVSA